MDFSTGQIYALALGVAGYPVESVLLVFSSLFLRQTEKKISYPWDLFAILPALGALVFVQGEAPSVHWGAGAVLLAAGCLHAASHLSCRNIKGRNDLLTHATEKQFSKARIFLLPLGFLGVLLPAKSLWIILLFFPALYLLSSFSGDLGLRFVSGQGQRARDEAAQSRQHLEDAQLKLKTLSEKQQMMEKLVNVFKEDLGPREAFLQLRAITSSVIPYDSLIFLKVKSGGQARVQDHHCEGDPRNLPQEFDLEMEPLLSKAWVKNRAIKGSGARTLVPTDNHLVAIPLKPLGLLYFGRRDKPFAKEEAGRLRFVTGRAEGGLKRAQERAEFSVALAEEKRVSQQLAHQVTLSSHLLTAAQKILGAPNIESIYDTLGTSAQSALEHHWGAVLSSEEAEPVFSWGRVPPLSELDRAHFLSPETKELVRKLGGEIATAYPITGEAEKLGALVIGRSPLKSLSGEEEDFLATLALLVAGGLDALRLNQRLQEAHQQLLQASRLSAIGRLAAGVAHELNSPLAAIGLAIESAMIRPEKGAEKLERASKALGRAKKIVSDLLQHSRTSGSKRSVVALRDVFEGLMSLVEAQLTERHLKIEKVCVDPKVGVLVNRDELDQVLINLILNAADASDDGAEILVKAWAEDLKVIIEVKDEGEGIPLEHQTKVFDPFFTTKSVGRGTGLGLSVCRELILSHDGEISFQSEPGEGTTFRLTLPRQLNWD